MKMKRLNRRTVLRGAAGAAIALPWLEAMAPSRANAATISKMGPNGAPKRFIMLFTPDGQGPDFLRCKNDAQGKLQLQPALAAMNPYVDDLLIFNGLNNQSGLNDPSSIDAGHLKPSLTVTTCVPSVESLAGGISIDQAIANGISAGTKIPSLELGSATGVGMSWRGARQRLPMLGDPRQAFTKLFSDFSTDTSALTRINAERRSVLDGLKTDYGALIGRMGGSDKSRLESHLDGIREVEKRLGSATTTCSVPGQPASTRDWEMAGDAHIDLLPLALACDLTRVASLVYEGPGGNHKLPSLPKGIHDASHDYGAEGWPTRNGYTAWFAGRFATLLGKLKALDEGGRSILDNSVVYWCSEHSCGNHNYDMMPTLVAGSGGGYLKTGRHVSYPNGTDGFGYVQYGAGRDKATGPGLSELYVSFLNAMGIEATKFGDPRFCRGPLPGLEA